MANIGKRLDDVSESLTLRLNAMAQELKAKGVDVINLTAGEPDFNVPEGAKAAVIDALNRNQSRYTATEGLLELRKLAADKTNQQQPKLGYKWSEKNVIVSNGAKHALFNSFMAICDPGDEILIPSPYWLTYPDAAKIAGARPVVIQTKFEDDFKLKPDQLERAITPRSKILVLNSPSNPTGLVYSRDELVALGRVLQQAKNLWVVSDEIYDRIHFGSPAFCSFLDAVPELQDRCVTVNGMSKSAAMTGWRIGWTVASENFTRAVSKLQGHATSGINSLAQWASIAALKAPPQDFNNQLQIYKKRREAGLEILSKSARIKVCPPSGAFYFFVGVSKCLRAGEDSIGFAERLLEKAKVAVVPGTPFGEPEYVRLSFAIDERTIQEGCKRLVEFVESD